MSDAADLDNKNPIDFRGEKLVGVFEHALELGGGRIIELGDGARLVTPRSTFLGVGTGSG